MKLSIENYNKTENEVLSCIGFAQHSAFGTKTFGDLGFPTRIDSFEQLVRYVDFFVGEDLSVLEPGKFFRGSSVETNYTMDEIFLLNKLSRGVLEYTEKLIGRKIGVFLNHLSAIGLFRVVQAISDLSGKESLSIFEVGPGCGYTGVLLGFQGHKYLSYDVTQGYYLWQHGLYDHFFGDDFTEVAANDQADLANLTRMAHMPWWRFMDLHKSNPLSADVVLSNANLGEMHNICLRYMLRAIRPILEKSHIGLLVFANVGACHGSSEQVIETELKNAGYKIVFSNNVFGFTLDEKEVPAAITQTLEERIPLFDPLGSGKTLGPTEFMEYRKEEFSDEFEFYSYLSDWPKFGN
jgi:hypothetical protein